MASRQVDPDPADCNSARLTPVSPASAGAGSHGAGGLQHVSRPLERILARMPPIAVVSDDNETIRLRIYEGDLVMGMVELSPSRAVALAQELLAAVRPKLAPSR